MVLQSVIDMGLCKKLLQDKIQYIYQRPTALVEECLMGHLRWRNSKDRKCYIL